MGAILTFPRSQTLRFINQNKKADLQTFDNRFASRLKYPFTGAYHYCQKINQSDNLWIQFRTNYTNITVNIVNASTDEKTDISGDLDLIYTDSSDRYYYNIFPNISGLTGLYYIEVYASSTSQGDVTFMSEIFNIQEEHKNTILLEWQGNYSYDDMMHWTDYKQFLRVEGHDRDITADQSKTIYQNTDYSPINLKSQPLRICSICINLVANWIGEKINIALSHDEFYCNGTRYNMEDLFEQTSLQNSMLQTIIIEATAIDFENGEDEEITGGTIAQSYIMINDADYVNSDDSSSKIKLNN